MTLPLEPLREHDLDDKPVPRPTSGPEIDDLDPATSDAGIDDGLLPDQPRRRGPSNGGGEWPTINIPETPALDIPRRGVDLNVYQHKKTLAQGMMDLALLSANANQLRYVLESDGRHPYYYPGLVLISMSIFLQVTVGVGLILNSRYNVKRERDIWKADRINNLTVLGIFLVTVTNIFISAFGVAASPSEVEPLKLTEEGVTTELFDELVL